MQISDDNGKGHGRTRRTKSDHVCQVIRSLLLCGMSCRIRHPLAHLSLEVPKNFFELFRKYPTTRSAEFKGLHQFLDCVLAV